MYLVIAKFNKGALSKDKNGCQKMWIRVTLTLLSIWRENGVEEQLEIPKANNTFIYRTIDCYRYVSLDKV